MPEPTGDNAQLKSNNMRSAIIIGLGGTGQEVIAMIKRMIIERFGGLDQLPIVSFLHLDTATEEAKLTPNSVLGHDISLTQRERATLKMPAMTDGGASYLNNHPMIREWFPPSLKIGNNFALGAGARRFNETHSSAFDAQYPQFNRRIESKADLPFDFCYLATNFNEQQAQFSKAALFELVAQNIFLEFTPGVAASKRAIRINIAEHGYRDPDGRLGQAQSFLSFGLATIEFPALRIEDCLAYRLAGEAMDYFSFRNAQPDSDLTVGAYNSDVLVDPDEIDTHYQDCAASPAKEYVGLKEEIERRLGKDGESVFRLVLEQPEQVKNISVEAARRRFLGVRNISIANKLAQLPQAEVDRRVQEAARRSHVLPRFDNDSLSAAGDTPGSRLTSHNPGFHSIAMLATCQPSEDEEVNLEPAPGRQPSKLARAFHSQVAGIQHEKALPDRYRLVFVREKGVFPLYCIADLKDLRDSYQNEMRQHNAKPRETDHRVDFPDLFPLDPRMEKMPARVRRALTLGRAFKFVRDDRDARTEEPALIYSFRNEHGRLNEIILGRDSDDAARAMAERQINKEVYRERTGEETWLEHLEKTIEQEGLKPVRLSEKEALWMRLQEHLSGLKRDLPDGERDHNYQREAEIIEEFCDGRGLRPPGDRADPKRETSPIAPPTQPFDYAAPTQTLGADELSFRERVTVKLRRSASGSLPPDVITKLMREAIEDYHITPGAAKQIIDQAQRQPVTAAEPDARSVEKYRELCRDILEGGAGFDESRAMLEDKRRRLNLTQAQARAIEKQVEDQVWREQKPVYLKEVK